MASSPAVAGARAELELGDRFEVARNHLPDRLSLPPVLGPDGFAIEHVEDAAGHPLEAAMSSTENSLIVPKLAEIASGPSATLWMEYRAPGRYRLIPDRGPAQPAEGELVTEQGVPIVLDPHDWTVVREASERSAGLETFDLALAAARLATHAGFDRLIALPLVREIEMLEHQVRTASTVLKRFRGRAMLCDEVGLGKTNKSDWVFGVAAGKIPERLCRGCRRRV